jgi:hypothetical protein
MVAVAKPADQRAAGAANSGHVHIGAPIASTFSAPGSVRREPVQ